MPKAFDVLVVGGGVVGSAIAYFLATDDGFRGRVGVVERDSLYEHSSSSLSASAIRQQFGCRPNIAASQFGIDFLRHAGGLLEVDGDRPDIALHEAGYLILGPDGSDDAFLRRAELQATCGVRTHVMDAASLVNEFPWLSVDGIGVGSLGLDGEGWFDGPGLHLAFRRKARSAGAHYVAGDVVGLTRQGRRMTGVQLADGRSIAAGIVVNAAGAWSGVIAGMADIDLPVVPRKRCVFVIESPARLGDAPFLFDPSGFWIRPEGQYYICGMHPALENPENDFTLDVDHALFEDRLWPALAHRIPAFEQLRMRRAWAGHYDYNLFDQSAVIGPVPGVPNLMLACGFSGHGMMHAPAAGAAVADLILHGGYRRIDMSAFAFERIAAGRPVAEHVY